MTTLNNYLKEIEELREFIVQDKIEKAIDSLLSLTSVVDDRILNNSIRLTCSNFYNYKSKYLNNLGNEIKERNKSVLALLEYIDEIEKYFKENLTDKPAIPERKNDLIKSEIFDAKILVVDDNNLNLSFFQAILEKNGFNKIFFAENGMDALELAMSKKIDLILLDIAMPVLDGFQTLKKLKENKIETRIIVHSAFFKSLEDNLKCIKDGACDYLTKPFAASDLIFKVKRALLLENTINTSLYIEDPYVMQLVEQVEERLLSYENTVAILKRKLLRKRFAFFYKIYAYLSRKDGTKKD